MILILLHYSKNVLEINLRELLKLASGYLLFYLSFQTSILLLLFFFLIGQVNG